MSNTYSIIGNNGQYNNDIGKINADYVVNNNGIMTFYNSEGKEVFWYVLSPGEGEGMSVVYGGDV